MPQTIPPPVGSAAGSGVQRLGGLRIDWLTVATVRVQPGKILSDAGDLLTVGAAIDVGWADIDTGAEETDQEYWIWLHNGGATVTISKSSTAPTGVTGGKRCIGWLFNLATGDIQTFVSEPGPDGSLDIRYHVVDPNVELRFVLATPPPTVFSSYDLVALQVTEANLDVPGCGTALVLGLYVQIDSYDDFTLQISLDGTLQYLAITGGGGGASDTQYTGYLPTRGPTLWLRKSGTSGGDTLFGEAHGWRMRRDGL